jgi:DNA polymerase III alpha subunit
LKRICAGGATGGGKGNPKLAIEDVAQRAEGLLCLTGCAEGAARDVARALGFAPEDVDRISELLAGGASSDIMRA